MTHHPQLNPSSHQPNPIHPQPPFVLNPTQVTINPCQPLPKHLSSTTQPKSPSIQPKPTLGPQPMPTPPKHLSSSTATQPKSTQPNPTHPQSSSRRRPQLNPSHHQQVNGSPIDNGWEQRLLSSDLCCSFLQLLRARCSLASAGHRGPRLSLFL